MSKQTAKNHAGAAIAAAAASSKVTTLAAAPTTPKHGAIVKHGKHFMVHVGSNYYNLFAASDKEKKNCLASGVTLEKAKALADGLVDLGNAQQKPQERAQEAVKPAAPVVPPVPAPKPAFDGIPSPESVAKRAEGLGVIKRTNAYFIDPKALTRREGWNPRFDMGEIDQLAKSLKANGMLNPIRVKRLTVNKDNQFAFELIDGDRRFTAIESMVKDGTYAKAFPDGIPAIIVDKAQDDMTSLFQMFEANSGKAFLPLEEAAAYQRMRDGDKEAGIKGLTIKQICERVGRKQVHVVEMLNLLKADAEVHDAVKSGAIGKTMAKRIATDAKGDAGKQKQLVAAAKSAGKDKGSKAGVKRQLDTARRAKAATKGKTLKIRALDNQELSALGAKVASSMADKMVLADLPLESDLRKWIQGNPDLALAASFGALEALKRAAGMDLSLEF